MHCAVFNNFNNYMRLISADNPLRCGCHLQPLKRLLSASNLRYSDLKDVACIKTDESKETIPLNDLSFEEYQCQ